MNIKTKILSIFILLVLTFTVFFSHAKADIVREANPWVYLFHLYFDNGRLTADRDFKFSYDLIAEPFVQSSLGTASPYKGEVVSLSDVPLGSFEFDPTVTRGKIAVKGPYFANASKVNFYNDSGQLLLTLSVANSSVCNEDGVCNDDFGESNSNCPTDCRLKPPPSESVTPAPPGGAGGRGFLTAIIVGIIAVVILIVWIIIKKRRANTGPATTPLPR